MLTKNFNKIGGTEFRVKDQILGYSNIISWVINNIELNNSETSLSEWNSKFIEWNKVEEIYTYKNKPKKNINRFSMIISNITNDMQILKKDESGKYVLNDGFDLDNIKDSFLFYLLKFRPERQYPFKKMIDFMLSNPEKNESKKIANAFMVFDGNESFADLYEKNIPREIALKTFSLEKSFSDNFNFRKHTKNELVMKKIFESKQQNQIISPEDINEYDFKNDKYLKKIVFKKNQLFSWNKFLEKINELSFEEYVLNLLEIKVSNIINDEYLDLFNRWMFGLGISNSSSKTQDKYMNRKIKCVSGHYKIEDENISLEYPFSLEETVGFLQKINEKDFNFKKSHNKLNSVRNSVLAEYFVNLFFCFKFSIKTTDFKKYVNTKVTNDLFPIFTAPGGVGDMLFKTNDVCFSIETTIHNTPLAIKKHEIFPCIDHLKKSIDNKTKKIKLFFVSFFAQDEIIIRAFSCLLDSEEIGSEKLLMLSFKDINLDFNIRY